jgi:long-chain acyl-CoA synthetase
MYAVSLTRSHFPAQTDDDVLGTTIPSVLAEAANETPRAIALIEADARGETGRRWSYEELERDTTKLARALCARFVPGERIAIWAPNLPEWVMIEFAAAAAGLTLVTVNPAYQAKELAYVLEQSRSVGVFLTREFRGNPMAEIAKRVCAELPAVRHVCDIQDHEQLFSRQSAPGALPDIASEHPVQIQYTSGTTGFPKGAVLTHRGLTNNARFTLNRLGVPEGSAYLNFMPMFHTAGCSIAVLGAVQKRAKLVLAHQFEGTGMNGLIESERVGAIMGVPTMLIGMLEALEREPRDVSSLSAAMSGGAMVPPELLRRFEERFDCRLSIIYGQTETSPVITQTRLGDLPSDKSETVGQPLPQTEISIRSIETNEVAAINEIGEICSRGYCNMISYNDNPEATTRTIDADGWLHTGDLGSMDGRGFVRVTGRLKDMIIRGGENLFPAEIENVLLEHPAVAEVAVVGVPDERWGEIAVCFLRPAEGALPSRDSLVAHCRKELAAPKTPAHFIAVETFPLTASGKIQKFVLREQFVAGAYPARL